MTELTAVCERSGGWWAVTVPQVKGLHTQARRLAQVPGMVLDAAGLLTGRPAGSFKVEVVPVLSGREQAELEELRQARRRAAAAESEAGRLSRSLAARLAGDGLTLRDVGAVMGLSHQRVAQLVG